MPPPSSSLYSPGPHLAARPTSFRGACACAQQQVGRWARRVSCSLSMNGCAAPGACAGDRGAAAAVCVREARALPAAPSPGDAVGQLRAAVDALAAPPAPSGIIRIEVPIRQRVDAVEWLHAQTTALMPRCFFSARAPLPHTPAELTLAGVGSNGNGGLLSDQWKQPVSVAGVGSAVFFRGTEPFSLADWRAIKRFLSKDCPMIRAYGAIRFDATSDVSVEWEGYGSFYFIVPQVEFNELEESSVLAITIAWDESLSWTWQNAVNDAQALLQKISPCSVEVNKSSLHTTIMSLNHVPTKASWDLAVTKALQMIKGRQRELVKVVLARCSRYITDTCIDPVELLACLKVEGQNAYQFCIQPADAPAFVGNSPEQLFYRKYLNISSEALAGTRARGKTRADDFQIGQDLLLSNKEDTEFTIVRDSIKKKLEAKIFDRGMYAGPVGWFGGAESEFAVGIRSALLGKGHSTLVYAGAGIVEGTNPSFEWDELDLKASQFAKLLQYQGQHIRYQEAENMGTVLRIEK
nr:unnamed protein product [Digitaria exilis]